MVQDMSNEGGQRGGRRMEVSLASRLLRAGWLGPEGSASREDGWGKGSLPVMFRNLRSNEGGGKGSRRI